MRMKSSLRPRPTLQNQAKSKGKRSGGTLVKDSSPTFSEDRWTTTKREKQECDQSAVLRKISAGALTTMAFGVVGYAIGSISGLGGAIAGGIIGLGAGTIVGASSKAGDGKGGDGLVYGVISIVAGATVGFIGGVVAGALVAPVGGTIAGMMAGGLRAVWSS